MYNSQEDADGIVELHTCAICLASPDNVQFSTLLCGHVFHTDCLEKSLKHNSRKKQCPSCRVSLGLQGA